MEYYNVLDRETGKEYKVNATGLCEEYEVLLEIEDFKDLEDNLETSSIDKNQRFKVSNGEHIFYIAVV